MLLECSGISKRFGGVHAVAEVDLAIAPQQVFGLIGPNGAGKTTLVNLISGQLRVDSGGIRASSRADARARHRGAHHRAHRARRAPCDGHVRAGRGAELRAQDRRGHASRNPGEPCGARGVSRERVRRMNAPLLEVEELRVRYGAVEAVHGVSFLANAGEVTALIGANGAGKSSTLAAISGLVPADGRIRFDGREIGGAPPHSIVRAGIVQVPEGREILARMTVEENLLMGLRGRDRAEIASAYERFPILRERRALLAGR